LSIQYFFGISSGYDGPETLSLTLVLKPDL